MSTVRSIPSEPLAAAVHLRIEELRREADAYRVVRDARSARRRSGAPASRRAASAWPASVVAALRDSLSGGSVSASGEDRGAVHHGTAPCGA